MKRIREPGLKQRIQEQIKRVITERELQPGDLLPPEGQLAEDLGVSRGSVREAIKSLESLGIVESKHGAGVCVREFNFDSILEFLSFGLTFQPERAGEILQIRAWLEESALTSVTAVIDAEALAEIEGLLDRWEEKAKRGESAREEDRSFHRMLYAPLNNPSLLSLIDIFWTVYHALETRKVAGDRTPLDTLKAHRELFEAVRARDAARARACLKEHFGNVEERFRAVVRSQRKNLTTGGAE